MKRLEGMIYGERLTSEESRGRTENSLKVAEITKAVESDGGRWGSSCGTRVLNDSCRDGLEGREAPLGLGSPGWLSSEVQPDKRRLPCLPPFVDPGRVGGI